MNRCIKRKSGGVMRISDYWLLEIVQQCQCQSHFTRQLISLPTFLIQ